MLAVRLYSLESLVKTSNLLGRTCESVGNLHLGKGVIFALLFTTNANVTPVLKHLTRLPSVLQAGAPGAICNN